MTLEHSTYRLSRRAALNAAAGLAFAAAFAGFAHPAAGQALPKGGTVEAVPNTKGPLRLAFLSFQNNPFFFPVRDGALAAAKYNDFHSRIALL